MAGNASRVRELRGMAAIWRDLGLRVLEMAGWEDRGRSSEMVFDCLGCHHTAASVDVDALLRDGRTGIPGPLCNVALHAHAPAGWKGEVVLIASGRANHFGVASISSGRGLGVEATGPPFPNYEAYVLLAAGYCIYFKRDPAQVIVPAGGDVHTAVRRVTAHKYVAQPEGRKINPSFDVPTFLRRVDAATTTTARGWWEVSIPQTELDKIKAEMEKALGAEGTDWQARVATVGDIIRAVQFLTKQGNTLFTANRPGLEWVGDPATVTLPELKQAAPAPSEPGAPVVIDQAAAQAIADALANNQTFLDAIAARSATTAGQRLVQDNPTTEATP